jgi:hypothetical protein
VALVRGNVDRAALLLGAVAALRKPNDSGPSASAAADHDAYMAVAATVQTALGDKVIAAAVRSGQRAALDTLLAL